MLAAGVFCASLAARHPTICDPFVRMIALHRMRNTISADDLRRTKRLASLVNQLFGVRVDDKFGCALHLEDSEALESAIDTMTKLANAVSARQFPRKSWPVSRMNFSNSGTLFCLILY